MTVIKALISGLCAMLIFAQMAFASTHPVHGHEARGTEAYGPGMGLAESLSRGDLFFSNDWPEFDELSEEEQYIISGSVSSRYSSNAGLVPWTTVIFSLVSQFYDAHGYVPDVLTPDMIRSIPGHAPLTDDQLDEFRSPITDDWPRLKESSFSRGNIYIRPLDAGEMEEIASLVPRLQRAWYGNELRVEGGKVPVNLLTKVFYLRVYGDSDVIYTNLIYALLAD
jgi:hypothetical protein